MSFISESKLVPLSETLTCSWPFQWWAAGRRRLSTVSSMLPPTELTPVAKASVKDRPLVRAQSRWLFATSRYRSGWGLLALHYSIIAWQFFAPPKKWDTERLFISGGLVLWRLEHRLWYADIYIWILILKWQLSSGDGYRKMGLFQLPRLSNLRMSAWSYKDACVCSWGRHP